MDILEKEFQVVKNFGDKSFILYKENGELKRINDKFIQGKGHLIDSKIKELEGKGFKRIYTESEQELKNMTKAEKIDIAKKLSK